MVGTWEPIPSSVWNAAMGVRRRLNRNAHSPRHGRRGVGRRGGGRPPSAGPPWALRPSVWTVAPGSTVSRTKGSRLAPETSTTARSRRRAPPPPPGPTPPPPGGRPPPPPLPAVVGVLPSPLPGGRPGVGVGGAPPQLVEHRPGGLVAGQPELP